MRSPPSVDVHTNPRELIGTLQRGAVVCLTRDCLIRIMDPSIASLIDRQSRRSSSGTLQLCRAPGQTGTGTATMAVRFNPPEKTAGLHASVGAWLKEKGVAAVA